MIIGVENSWMEIWDAYKRNGDLAGCDLVRGQPIPEGLFHAVCLVLVKHIDGTYLLVQRDWNKIGYPGFYEAGAGGSILKGETPYQGAVRELREETGIYSDELTLVFSQSDLKNTFYFGFVCITDCLKEAIILQKGETIDYRWLNREDFIQFLYSPEFIPIHRECWLPYLNRV